MKRLLIIFGTRPEAIKMAPLALCLKKFSELEVKICVTGQHRQMLDQVLDFFHITPDYDLNLMKENQKLEDLTCRIIEGVSRVLLSWKPDCVLVHGDTTTCLASSIAAFYQKVPIGHVEAGLRTHDSYSPFPEEMNRALTARMANFHFVPSSLAKENLIREGISADKIFLVGNTIVDALFLGLEKINNKVDPEISNLKEIINKRKKNHDSKLILVTGHRRENFGKGLENICMALKGIVEKFPNTLIVYPVHPNPNVSNSVFSMLGNSENFLLIDPLDYKLILWLMNEVHLIITDSGGIQEEAPSLGKPVLVTRVSTERPEAVNFGAVVLTGPCQQKIIQEASTILSSNNEVKGNKISINPYGDGKASERIASILMGKPYDQFRL